MARKPQVRYFDSRKAYYCQFRGRQHLLAAGPNDGPNGPTFRAAVKAFGELFALANASQAGDENTCRVVLEKYLCHIQPKAKPRTFAIRQFAYQGFTPYLGEVRVKDLTHAAVYDWLKDKRKRFCKGRLHGWTNGSVRTAIDSLQVAFNWAMRSGLISRNPLFGIEKPSPRSRGREAVLRPGDHEKIMSVASRAFRPFLCCLENTGCRPSELAAATAQDFDGELGAIVYHGDDVRLEGEFSHKTASKGKTRAIILTGEALDIVRSLVMKHPTGPLFRTSRRGKGGAWRVPEVVRQFRTIRERLGKEFRHLTAYSYRHTFATAWLSSGRSVDLLAELMGNSPQVIRKHYSHLLVNRHTIRRELEAFKASLAEERQNQPPDVLPFVS